MLRKEKGKECSLSLRTLSPTEQNQQRHQVTASEKEELSLGRTSKAVQSLDKHRDRDYKVPFVQLLQSPDPHREELSLRSPLDSGLHVSYSLNLCIIIIRH